MVMNHKAARLGEIEFEMSNAQAASAMASSASTLLNEVAYSKQMQANYEALIQQAKANRIAAATEANRKMWEQAEAQYQEKLNAINQTIDYYASITSAAAEQAAEEKAKQEKRKKITIASGIVGGLVLVSTIFILITKK